MDLKNNLFRYATSELSQDAVLCWLVSYALESAKPDRVLQTCAKELLELFVPELKGKTFTLTNVERQVMHMDVLLTAATNKEIYKIVIEDKTYTGEHSGQLTRYLDQLRETYPDCIPRGVYYKTGFQSDLSAVENAGYQIISRAQMLEFLAPYVKKQTIRFCWTTMNFGMTTSRLPSNIRAFRLLSGAGSRFMVSMMTCKPVIFLQQETHGWDMAMSRILLEVFMGFGLVAMTNA